MKRNLRTARRRIAGANIRRKPYVVREYLDARTRYKEEIQSSITRSWVSFCENTKSDDIWTRTNKILKQSTSRTGDVMMKGSDGVVLTAEDSARLLANSFSLMITQRRIPTITRVSGIMLQLCLGSCTLGHWTPSHCSPPGKWSRFLRR